MTPLTPDQIRTRDRFETVIGLASPVLNAVLAVGERISRLVEPDDHEYYPPRATQAEPPPPRSGSASGD